MKKRSLREKSKTEFLLKISNSVKTTMSSIVEDAKDVLTKKVSSKAESIREMLRAFELKWSLPVLFKEIEEKARRGGDGDFKALTEVLEMILISKQKIQVMVF